MNSVRTELRSVVGRRFPREVVAIVMGPSAVEQVRFVPVVRAATKLNVLDRELSAHRRGNHVMEFEEAALLAPAPVRADESTPVRVTPGDRSLHLGRWNAWVREPAAAWPLGRAEPLSPG